MKLTSIGGIAAVVNLFVGFTQVHSTDPFWVTMGAFALVVGGRHHRYVNYGTVRTPALSFKRVPHPQVRRLFCCLDYRF